MEKYDNIGNPTEEYLIALGKKTITTDQPGKGTARGRGIRPKDLWRTSRAEARN